MEQKTRRFAFESLSASLALGLEAAPTTEPVIVSQALDRLQTVDARSAQRVQQLLQTQSSTIALEAMARSLKKPAALEIGRMGAHYFNVACEALMEQGRIEQAALPFTADGGEERLQMPDRTEQAYSAIELAVQEAVRITRGDITELMVSLYQKREGVMKVVRALHARLNEVEEDLKAVEQGEVEHNPHGGAVVVGTHASCNLIAYSGLGVVNNGATVVADYNYLLDEHMALYGRLIDFQGEWVRRHKDNVLHCSGGFEDYTFNPAMYLAAGVQLKQSGENGAPSVFQSRSLPGMMVFVCQTSEYPSSGYSALHSLITSTAYLAADTPAEPKNTPSVQEIKALSLMDLRARVKELRLGLIKVNEWSDYVHRDLWGKALFNDAIVEMLIGPQSADVAESVTPVRQLAGSVVKLLNEASCDMGTNVLASYACLVSLLEESIRAHVPRHVDGGA